jgi:hypothetical protein
VVPLCAAKQMPQCDSSESFAPRWLCASATVASKVTARAVVTAIRQHAGGRRITLLWLAILDGTSEVVKDDMGGAFCKPSRGWADSSEPWPQNDRISTSPVVGNPKAGLFRIARNHDSTSAIG